MYPHSFLWHYLWIAPHAFQVVIAVLMVRRRLFREFPFFFAYTLSEVVQNTILFVMDHASWVSAYEYWYVYWAGMVVSILLRFAVIYEVLAHLFRPYRALAGPGRLLFRWSAALLLLVAVAMSAYSPGDSTRRIIGGVQVMSWAASLVQCGLVFSLFLFSSYFRLSWRSFAFGIAAGMGIFSSVDLAVMALNVRSGSAAASYVFDFITMAAYHCCVLIWLAYLFVPEPVPGRVRALPAGDSEEWILALRRLLLQ